jgi:hypothetical protein
MGEWARLAAASQSVQGVREVSGSGIIGRCNFLKLDYLQTCRLAVRRKVGVGVVRGAVGQKDLLASGERGTNYFQTSIVRKGGIVTANRVKALLESWRFPSPRMKNWDWDFTRVKSQDTRGPSELDATRAPRRKSSSVRSFLPLALTPTWLWRQQTTNVCSEPAHADEARRQTTRGHGIFKMQTSSFAIAKDSISRPGLLKTELCRASPPSATLPTCHLDTLVR